jgi:hypothetical protein
MRISNYNENTASLTSFRSDDNVMNVPVGGGFAFAYKAFIADVRGGWTAIFYNDLLTDDVTTSDALNPGTSAARRGSGSRRLAHEPGNYYAGGSSKTGRRPPND